MALPYPNPNNSPLAFYKLPASWIIPNNPASAAYPPARAAIRSGVPGNQGFAVPVKVAPNGVWVAAFVVPIG